MSYSTTSNKSPNGNSLDKKPYPFGTWFGRLRNRRRKYIIPSSSEIINLSDEDDHDSPRSIVFGLPANSSPWFSNSNKQESEVMKERKMNRLEDTRRSLVFGLPAISSSGFSNPKEQESVVMKKRQLNCLEDTRRSVVFGLPANKPLGCSSTNLQEKEQYTQREMKYHKYLRPIVFGLPASMLFRSVFTLDGDEKQLNLKHFKCVRRSRSTKVDCSNKINRKKTGSPEVQNKKLSTEEGTCRMKFRLYCKDKVDSPWRREVKVPRKKDIIVCQKRTKSKKKKKHAKHQTSCTITKPNNSKDKHDMDDFNSNPIKVEPMEFDGNFSDNSEGSSIKITKVIEYNSQTKQERFESSLLEAKQLEIEYREEVMNIVNLPYKEDEYIDLWNRITRVEPVDRTVMLRGGDKTYQSKTMGRSLLSYQDGLAKLIEIVNDDKEKVLILLRWYFYYEKNISSFKGQKPWMDKEMRKIFLKEG